MLFKSVTFKTSKKKNFQRFFAFYFLKVPYIYIIFQRKNVIKKSHSSRKKCFLTIFCLMIEGSGFEYGKPKNIRTLRIRIRNNGRNFTKKCDIPEYSLNSVLSLLFFSPVWNGTCAFFVFIVRWPHCSDPDPDWIRIQLGQRVWIGNPNKEGKNWPPKKEQ